MVTLPIGLEAVAAREHGLREFYPPPMSQERRRFLDALRRITREEAIAILEGERDVVGVREGARPKRLDAFWTMSPSPSVRCANCKHCNGVKKPIESGFCDLYNELVSRWSCCGSWERA